MNDYMNLIGKRARKASQYKIDTKVKNSVLASYAKMLDENKGLIIKENTKDINYAKKIGLKENLINRLHLNEKKINDIRNSIISIIRFKDPINHVLEKWKRPNGLNISRVSIPIGVIGVMLRRNVIVIFMSIELMLNAVNLSFVTFSRSLDSMTGVVFIFFIIVVAAAEAVVGLSIILSIYRTRKSLNIEEFNLLKW